jgi:hypothetical protein
VLLLSLLLPEPPDHCSCLSPFPCPCPYPCLCRHYWGLGQEREGTPEDMAVPAMVGTEVATAVDD